MAIEPSFILMTASLTWCSLSCSGRISLGLDHVAPLSVLVRITTAIRDQFEDMESELK
jgi:hypothetical protein